jgi:hypothetical protein
MKANNEAAANIYPTITSALTAAGVGTFQFKAIPAGETGEVHPSRQGPAVDATIDGLTYRVISTRGSTGRASLLILCRIAGVEEGIAADWLMIDRVQDSDFQKNLFNAVRLIVGDVTIGRIKRAFS